MRTLIPLMLALFASSFSASAQMPYPLWRNVGGTNCNVQPLYTWRSDMVARFASGQSTDELAKERPYSDWIGANFWEHFTVKEVRQPDLLLVQCRLDKGSTNTSEIVLQHYPRLASVTEGQTIDFLACPMGQCSWTNAPGAVKALPLFDYGTPCGTVQQARVGAGKNGGV